ncbi:MAG: MurR/RpiR family transcriptional regulator [Bacillota bacterium]|nr:MurR/RpiR family transcriptional regulator [Bacillota bacterium]
MLLNEKLETLSKKELEILQYVHENLEEIQKMSIQTFAKNINYSTSTVLRFCRKLGFQGFSEFKYQIRDQIKKINIENNEEQTFGQVKARLLSDLDGTASLIQTDDLMKIAKLLSKNLPVYIFSPGGITNIASEYLESMLFMAGCRYVYRSDSKKTFRHFIQTVNKNSIFIFISYSGNSPDTLQMAKEAKMHGMIVVSISSIENNDLAEVSNYNLRFFSNHDKKEAIDMTSRLCTFFVLSSLIENYGEYKKGNL